MASDGSPEDADPPSDSSGRHDCGGERLRAGHGVGDQRSREYARPEAGLAAAVEQLRLCRGLAGQWRTGAAGAAVAEATWPASFTSVQNRGQSTARDTLDTDSIRFRYACGKAHADCMYPPRGQKISARKQSVGGTAWGYRTRLDTYIANSDCRRHLHRSTMDVVRHEERYRCRNPIGSNTCGRPMRSRTTFGLANMGRYDPP